MRTLLDHGEGDGDGGAVVLAEVVPNMLGPLTDANGDFVEANARNPSSEDVGFGSSISCFSGGGDGRLVSLGFTSSSASSLGLFEDSELEDFLGDTKGLRLAYAMKPACETAANEFAMNQRYRHLLPRQRKKPGVFQPPS